MQGVTTLNAAGQPVCDQPIVLAPDISRQWFLTPDQRKRATVNGIWDIGYGVQLSGKYLYGDNGWVTPTPGVDVRLTGSTSGRMKADGTLIPRNSFDKPSIHKVDMSLKRNFRLRGNARIEGIVEMFNVLNHRNLNALRRISAMRKTGSRRATRNIDYQPRMMQFAFRLSAREASLMRKTGYVIALVAALGVPLWAQSPPQTDQAILDELRQIRHARASTTPGTAPAAPGHEKERVTPVIEDRAHARCFQTRR